MTGDISNRSARSVAGGVICAATVLIALVAQLGLAGCGNDDDNGTPELVSSRSYRGHATDADINHFVRVHPHTIGTRLDDCQTCHHGSLVRDAGGKEVQANPCDYCHYVIHKPQGWSQLPAAISETLNPYGLDYKQAGRDLEAVRAIAALNSDGDGFSNATEVEDIRYPGDPGSHPGLALCPMIRMTGAEIRALPRHSQFGLANANKQQFDYYANYTGVKIKDLLAAQGIDLSGATSVDILAPDGFAHTFTISQIVNPLPPHRFFPGLGVADLGTDCAFVEYPEETRGYAYGDTIRGEQWHILAYQRENAALEPCYLDPTSGRIEGEGPFRNVLPPGAADDALNQPDRGKNWDTSGCTMPEWNYDSNKDHNAGAMVKGAVILRINPMPDGYEEFDILNGGWAMVDADEILIYGQGVTAR